MQQSLLELYLCSFYSWSQVRLGSKPSPEMFKRHEKDQTSPQACVSIFIQADRHDLKDVSWRAMGNLGLCVPEGISDLFSCCFSFHSDLSVTGLLAATELNNIEICAFEISRSYSGFLVTLKVQDAAVASLFTSILLEPLGHLRWDFYIIILSSIRGIRRKIRQAFNPSSLSKY